MEQQGIYATFVESLTKCTDGDRGMAMVWADMAIKAMARVMQTRNTKGDDPIVMRQ